jgi:hypothetical protein
MRTNRSFFNGRVPGGDLLGAVDHRVDRSVVTLVTRELVLVDHPPAPGGLPGAHDPRRFEDLPVVEGVAVPFEVRGQVVGGGADPRADDEAEPGGLDPVQVRRGEHPGVGDHHHVADLVALRERGQDRQQRLRLGSVALEAVHLQREPGGVDEQPDLDLWIDPAVLAHADLAELVLILGLEVQRRDVVEHDRCQPAAPRVADARF